ncbi:MAG: 3-oxoacid CoA-transferase subunit B [Chloroflexi bacterium]|nr:3-oxoacid CoA-transferase subunit B [Chloroflexota bacterium]MCY3697062.1 3-oxoacid CoA-transferase subunit B [Chloroflexota bacterium]MYB23205.1 3-oxoacid CoA-transferase subunit B [Chloroflexota bacterium]MYF80732.1 3-oxoacid CoA-transferase subunit B [Chloroflexota bacterium]MYI04593.1 3-oxoacid CoA-transferase subunit B [Chloroflexota bacterium]
MQGASPPVGLSRELIALRAARELEPGSVVNLGIGLPTLVAGFVEPTDQILFQAENGILGYAGISESAFDSDLINAGGQPVDLVAGASFFDTADSFAMIRGGHIDAAILGGLQVSAQGDLANWYVPARGGGSVGGAMDLAVGARKLIVAMAHVTREGEPRIVEVCDYPLTAERCVDVIISDLAVIDVTTSGLRLRETAPGVSIEQVVAWTAAALVVSEPVREMTL